MTEIRGYAIQGRSKICWSERRIGKSGVHLMDAPRFSCQYERRGDEREGILFVAGCSYWISDKRGRCTPKQGSVSCLGYVLFYVIRYAKNVWYAYDNIWYVILHDMHDISYHAMGYVMWYLGLVAESNNRFACATLNSNLTGQFRVWDCGLWLHLLQWQPAMDKVGNVFRRVDRSSRKVVSEAHETQTAVYSDWFNVFVVNMKVWNLQHRLDDEANNRRWLHSADISRTTDICCSERTLMPSR